MTWVGKKEKETRGENVCETSFPALMIGSSLENLKY